MGEDVNAIKDWNPRRQLLLMLRDVMIHASRVRIVDSLQQRIELRKVDLAHLQVIESLHHKISLDALTEKFCGFAACGDVTPGYRQTVILCLRISETERGSLFGLAKDVRNAVGVAAD